MEASDKSKFAASLVGLGELYDRVISVSVAAIYFEDLKAYPLQTVLDALAAHRRDPDRGRFFPKVADLIHKLECSSEEIGLTAWAEVRRLLGDSHNAMSSDPIAERVVQDLGGWVRLGLTDIDKLVWVEKEFVRRYAMYEERGDKLLLGPRQGLKRIGAIA
jgi:hypothetical protein